jgi:cold shock protein
MKYAPLAWMAHGENFEERKIVKTFTRTQLRTVFEDWKVIVQHQPTWFYPVENYLDFLYTYQFKGGVVALASRATGVVKWFNKDKGFGFIIPDGGGDKAEEIFVHYSSLSGLKTLKEGDKVEFDVESGSKGLKAVDVVAL